MNKAYINQVTTDYYELWYMSSSFPRVSWGAGVNKVEAKYPYATLMRIWLWAVWDQLFYTILHGPGILMLKNNSYNIVAFSKLLTKFPVIIISSYPQMESSMYNVLTQCRPTSQGSNNFPTKANLCGWRTWLPITHRLWRPFEKGLIFCEHA